MPAEAPAVSNVGLSTYVGKPLIFANGSPLVVRGTCSLPVHIGKHSVVHEFLVVENLSAGPLLGSDFLQSHGVNLNFSSNFFSWSGSAVAFESSHLPCRLVLTDIIQIPSQSSCLCKGQVQTYDGVPLDVGVRLFQPGERLTGMGIIAALTLVDGGTGTVPVHLVNFNHEQTLYQGMTLGTLEIVDSLQLPDPSRNSAFVNTIQNGMQLSEEEQRKFLDNFDLDNDLLSEDEQSKLKSLPLEYRSAFACAAEELGSTQVTCHTIPTGEHKPVKMPPYRTPHHLKPVLKEQIESMLDNNIISPSSSPWSSPVVLVRKKDGSCRFCVDFRKLNAITERDSFPLPRIDDTFDCLGGAKFFSQSCSSLSDPNRGEGGQPWTEWAQQGEWRQRTGSILMVRIRALPYRVSSSMARPRRPRQWIWWFSYVFHIGYVTSTARPRRLPPLPD